MNSNIFTDFTRRDPQPATADHVAELLQVEETIAKTGASERTLKAIESDYVLTTTEHYGEEGFGGETHRMFAVMPRYTYLSNRNSADASAPTELTWKKIREYWLGSPLPINIPNAVLSAEEIASIVSNRLSNDLASEALCYSEKVVLGYSADYREKEYKPAPLLQAKMKAEYEHAKYRLEVIQYLVGEVEEVSPEIISKPDHTGFIHCMTQEELDEAKKLFDAKLAKYRSEHGKTERQLENLGERLANQADILALKDKQIAELQETVNKILKSQPTAKPQEQPKGNNGNDK